MQSIRSYRHRTSQDDSSPTVLSVHVCTLAPPALGNKPAVPPLMPPSRTTMCGISSRYRQAKSHSGQPRQHLDVAHGRMCLIRGHALQTTCVLYGGHRHEISGGDQPDTCSMFASQALSPSLSMFASFYLRFHYFLSHQLNSSIPCARRVL